MAIQMQEMDKAGEEGTNAMNEPQAEHQDARPRYKSRHVLKELPLECLSFSDFFSDGLFAPIGQSLVHSLNDMPDLDADLLMIGLRQPGRPLYLPCTSGLTPGCNFPGKLKISLTIRSCPCLSTGITAFLSLHRYFSVHM